MENLYLVAAAWVFLARLSSLISVRLGISVALVEIAVGILAGNTTGL
jgi:NhaP-type Na+/H+ and K+/H+ antiporter